MKRDDPWVLEFLNVAGTWKHFAWYNSANPNPYIQQYYSFNTAVKKMRTAAKGSRYNWRIRNEITDEVIPAELFA